MDKQDLDLLLSKISNQDEASKNKKRRTKRQYFITYQSHFSIEINAHSLVYLIVLVSEGQLPTEALNIWLQNSQTCESTFRSARSMSSSSSAGVNFTVSQFINRINKLSALQYIKDHTDENKLRFPHHHKLSTASRGTTNLPNTTDLSKAVIEKTITNAYKFVTDLFTPLNIKELLRNGRMLSIDELSRTVAKRLEAFWSVDIDANNAMDPDSDSESEDEINCDSNDDSATDDDSDEESDLNNDSDVVHNATTSSYDGMRLFNHVKDDLAHTFFKVHINNEEKYLHKQTGCWLLEKDKISLSADRLSRVQGR